METLRGRPGLARDSLQGTGATLQSMEAIWSALSSKAAIPTCRNITLDPGICTLMPATKEGMLNFVYNIQSQLEGPHLDTRHRGGHEPRHSVDPVSDHSSPRPNLAGGYKVVVMVIINKSAPLLSDPT